MATREECGGEWGRIVREFGINIHTVLYVKQITNKDPLNNKTTPVVFYP